MAATSAAVTASQVTKVAQTAVTTEELLSVDNNILDELILMFEKGLNQPIVYWQVATLAVSVLLGWFLGRYIQKKITAYYTQRHADYQALIEEAKNSDESVAERAFWDRVGENLALLGASMSWALLSMLFISIGTVLVRLAGLLPKHSLPIESVVWLILSAYLVVRLIVFIIHQSVGRSRFTAGLDSALTWSIWICVALQIVGVLPKVITFMKTTQIPLGSGKLTLWALLLGVLSIALALFAAKWIGQFFEKWINTLPTIQSNVRAVIIRIVKVILVFIAILIGLASVGIDITVLGVFGGALGVGLGFGLQKIASNYVSGFIILLDRSVKIGDLVTVSDVQGIVTDIKTRYTVVRAFDGSVTIIPNESFVTSNVQNTSYLQGPGRTTVVMSVDYSTDVEEVIELMTETVRKQPRVLKTPAPYTILSNFGADGIDLTSYFWVSDPEAGTMVLRSTIRRQLLAEFNKRKISIPFPQRDLHVVSLPDVICRVESDPAPQAKA